MDKIQLSFPFYGEELNELNGLAKRCYHYVRKKYPQMIGEPRDEWKNFIVSETLLELAERLKEIALRRQNIEIDIKYGGKFDR